MEAKRSRKPFTPGWEQTLTKVEGLPIKSGNKIIPMLRTKRAREPADDEENQERIVDIEDLDGKKGKDKKLSKALGGEEGAQGGGEAKKAKKDKVKRSKELVSVPRTNKQLQQLQQQIGEMCLQITANPEDCVLRKKKDQGGDDDEADDASAANDEPEKSFHLQDLLEFAQSNDVQELELALPSATLVFRDICPGYRIRLQEDVKDGVAGGKQLKKDTKRLMDFERLLLHYYQKFLVLLEERVSLGFGGVGENLQRVWGAKERIAFIALKCQCELLKALSHFNFRNVLLSAVVSRANPTHPEVVQVCCAALEHVLKKDTLGDVSHEFVATLNKVLKNAKFHAPEALLKLLQTIKVSISVDEGKKFQILAKNQKKKRKQVRDEVEIGLMEADANNDEIMRKKYQVNALQEISLVYFRIIKQKAGYALFPVALEGLSKITHLLDIDTVADLMALLKTLLDTQSPAAPLEVRVMAVFCAMKTLAGPGAELKMDDEPYLMHLKQTLRELPLHCESNSTWAGALECVDLILLKRREERAHFVSSITRILLFHSSFHMQDSVGPVLLSLVHAVLLRYPRVRQETAAMRASLASSSLVDNKVAKTLAKQLSALEEEEKVEDFAMKALKEGETMKNTVLAADEEENQIGDGTWLLALFRHNIDTQRYKKTVEAMGSRDMLPLPLRMNDVYKSTADTVMDRLNASLSSLSAKKSSSAPEGANSKNNAHNNKHKNNKSTQGFGKKNNGKNNNKGKGKKK